jgi:hypothetical protein
MQQANPVTNFVNQNLTSVSTNAVVTRKEVVIKNDTVANRVVFVDPRIGGPPSVSLGATANDIYVQNPGAITTAVFLFDVSVVQHSDTVQDVMGNAMSADTPCLKTQVCLMEVSVDNLHSLTDRSFTGEMEVKALGGGSTVYGQHRTLT